MQQVQYANIWQTIATINETYTEIKKRGATVKKADYITEDGYSFYIQADFSVADTPDGVDSDMSWPTIKDFQDDMKTEGIEITSNHDHTD